jgi:hypothetical protein
MQIPGRISEWLLDGEEASEAISHVAILRRALGALSSRLLSIGSGTYDFSWSQVDVLLEAIDMKVLVDSQITSSGPFQVETVGGISRIDVGPAIRESFVLDVLPIIYEMNELADFGRHDVKRDGVANKQLSHLGSRLVQDFARELEGMLPALHDVEPMGPRLSLLDAISQMRDKVAALDTAGRIEDATERAERAASAAEESAGITGRASLAEHFSKMATQQRDLYVRWKAASVLIAVVAVGAAVLHFGTVTDMDVEDIVRKFAVGVPLLLLFLACAREASVHRDHALWCEHMAVQLRTVQAYTSDLESDLKSSVLGGFAGVVFSGPPRLHGRHHADPSGGTSSSELGLITDVLRQSARPST